MSLPQRFELQVDYLRRHPECVALGTWAILTDAEGWPIGQHSSLQTHEEIDERHERGSAGQIIHPTVMCPRVALTTIGGYRVELRAAQDYDLFLRLAELGRVANLPHVLLRYRQQRGSVGQRGREIQINETIRILREARQRRGLPALTEDPAWLRPDAPSSSTEIDRVWAYMALAAGNVGTARKYALSRMALPEA